ncbi:ATP-binding protein [Desulfotomaculum copahuensis]|uniref:histidine kinase n=1 Tax=Desulfotomaculum copahuensis TaxID=1838280 RepID=A0A1B7LHF5_9FIRM|nr:ATP-binding protein [Desulfotomaculum copahuensis]OAT85724.1 histidine kinase [Desulfotomaculum copahuensis]
MEELAEHILDIARNSIEAGATRLTIAVAEDTEENYCCLSVVDNGAGMARELVRRLMDPFFTTKSGKKVKVGLGLPLLKDAVERCGGRMEVHSAPGRGTRVTAEFPYHHLDRAPLGDIAGTIATLLAGNNHLDIFYRYNFNGREMYLDTREIRARLRGVPLDTPEVLIWLRQYLSENEEILHGGEDYEIARRAG